MLLREFVRDHLGLFVRFDLGPRGRETGQKAQIELMNCGLLLTLESILDLPHIDHSVSSLWFLPPLAVGVIRAARQRVTVVTIVSSKISWLCWKPLPHRTFIPCFPLPCGMLGDQIFPVSP